MYFRPPAVNKRQVINDVKLTNERLCHTEKLLDGCVETQTNIRQRGYLVVRLQEVHDDSADDYEYEGRYHQDDRRQRLHVDL